MQVNGKVSKVTNSRGASGTFATSGGTMRALLLARKSNKVQINAAERGDGLSLETQDETARAYALAQDWTTARRDPRRFARLLVRGRPTGSSLRAVS